MKNISIKEIIASVVIVMSFQACQPADVADVDQSDSANVDAAQVCLTTKFSLDERKAFLTVGHEQMAWIQLGDSDGSPVARMQAISDFLENLNFTVTQRTGELRVGDDATSVTNSFDTQFLVASGNVDIFTDDDTTPSHASGIFIRAGEGVDLEAVVSNACEAVQQ